MYFNFCILTIHCEKQQTVHAVQNFSDKLITVFLVLLIISLLSYFAYDIYCSIFPHSLQYNRSVKIFSTLADKIIKLFPSELRTNFFINPVYNERGVQCAKTRGRLIDRYYNVLKKFKNLKLSPSARRIAKLSEFGSGKENNSPGSEATIIPKKKRKLNFQLPSGNLLFNTVYICSYSIR